MKSRKFSFGVTLVGSLFASKAAAITLPLSGVNTSTPTANLSPPNANKSTPALTLKSIPAFVYPGGNSTLYLPPKYSPPKQGSPVSNYPTPTALIKDPQTVSFGDHQSKDESVNAPFIQTNANIDPPNQTSNSPVVYIHDQKPNAKGTPLAKDGKKIFYSSGSIYVGNSATPVPSVSTPQALALDGFTFAVIPQSFDANLIQPQPSYSEGRHSGSEGGEMPATAVNGQTIAPHKEVYTLAGMSFVFVQQEPATQKPATPSISSLPLPYVGRKFLTANSTSQYLIGTQTLITSASAITVSRKPISIPSTSNLAVITIGSPRYTADAASNILIGSQTLAPGSVITVSGTSISLAPQATDIVIGPSTHSVNLGSLIIGAFGLPSKPTVTPVTLNGVTISAASTAAIISGTTYTSSTMSTPKTLNIGSATVTLGRSGISKVPTNPDPATIDDITFSVNPSQAVISGTTIAISGLTTVVIGSKTLTIFPPTSVTPTLSPVTTTITAPSSSTSVSEQFTGSVSRLRCTDIVWMGAIFTTLMIFLAV